MAEARATVTRRRGISRIWLVPIVAVLLGAWMVVYTWRNQGPEISIVFPTAEGIEAGKTKIKALDVEVGLVESVVLGEDLESVVVTARIEHSAMALLREDTQFWVVRARIGTGGVSGLGTILSGGYIQLAPGSGPQGRRRFVGLDEPPATPAGTPGLNLLLVSERAGSVGTGDPILYKGFPVGRIESAELDVDTQRMRYRAFVKAPFDDLVSTTTRFWNTSGLSFSATADGIELSTGSLQTLLVGGVAFGLPDGVEAGDRVEDGALFDLYPDHDSIDERPYSHSVEYVVQFARSVRGLVAGAPVEYRGLRSGRVERILLEQLTSEGGEGQGRPIPVLIRLEPGRLDMEDSEEGVERLTRTVAAAVRNGLRASLATGNLLTGSLYVALDIYPEEKPGELGQFAGRPSIPTISTGLEGIQMKVTALLDKLNALPLGDVTQSADDTLRSAEDTLKRLERTIEDLRVLLASEGVQNLPKSVETSLAELDRTLRSVQGLAGTLEDQPNALIFPRANERDPEPPAGSR
jgi:paraquat-inducible protein B